MSDQELENGCLLSNSGGCSRRSSDDSIDDIRGAEDSCEAKQNGPIYSQDLEETCRKFGLSLAENGLIENGPHEHDLSERFNEPPSDNNSRSEMNQDDGLGDNLEEAGTLAENGENAEQNQVKEKWERDSGMELTSSDSTLQQIMAAASNAKGAARSSNFLELASTLHLAALGSLKTDMAETTTMLEEVKRERDSLQALLEQSAQERKDTIRDYEERLSSQAQQSEEHITELQSVIAELSKKANQNSANKIDEVEEVEIESQTSEHGSQSDSDSLDSSAPEDDEMDEEISKVVDDFGFAIEREKPADKDARKGKRERRENEKIANEERETREGDATQEPTSKLNGEDANAEKEKLRRKCSELQVRCLEFEKKSQILERQLQQASLREYVSRKRSSGSAGSVDNQEVQVVTSERDGLKTRLQEAEEALDQARGEAAGFKNERDRLRKRLIEMQEQLKSLHQRSVQFENRVRSQSLESGTKSPRMLRANQPGTSWEQRNHFRTRAPSGPASSASSDISSRDGTMTSPRISRRSSTDNLNSTGMSSRSGHSNSGSLKRPGTGHLVGPALSPAESAHSVRQPCAGVPSVPGQVVVRPAMISDYGSAQGSTPEITVLAKAVDEGLDRGITGENCIRALSQLPEFSAGKMPAGLVHALEGCRSARDVYTALFNFCDEQANAELKQYELDLERLKSRFEHLQAQNNVISRSLEESRDNAERLSVLMGKYESNHTAYQLALNACDKSLEAYTVLLQLAELEQASLVLKFQAAGSRLSHQSSAKFAQGPSNRSNCGELVDREMGRSSLDLETCLKRKNLVENTACVLLQRLDRRYEQQGIAVPQRQSSSSHSRTNSFGSSNEVEFTREEEARLRTYVERLKSERLTIGMTIQKLDSITGVPEPKRMREESLDPRLDLENAVLMQELMALKEEKAELKAKNYLIEKEKKALELRITSRDAKEQAYLVHIDHLKSEMQDEIKRRRKLQKENGVASSKSDDKSGTSSGTPSVTLAELRTTDEDIPSDLYEAAKREKKLKARIQELMETLETLSKNSEIRHQQTAEYVSDLKKANGALVAAYEKAKKKHGARLRKLEQQMMAMVERHDKQVRTLKERIALLEEDDRMVPVKQNETAL